MKGRPRKKQEEKKARINITLDKQVHIDGVEKAKKRGKSLSSIINDKLKRMR